MNSTISIGDICETIPSIGPETKGMDVDTLFKNNLSLQGIVVTVDNQPIALVMRNHFYQEIGQLYGYNLYMGRSIELLMNKTPLIVEYTEPIVDVSQLAMERKEEELYDYVIVTKNGEYVGVVSIQHLLLTFATIQKETARFMNPLTGLPGNHLIDQKLKGIVNSPMFSVMYIDLDHFKEFNDTYGFKLGDEMILATADILSRYLSNDFVGHIGGDDFIAILNTYEYEKVAKQIIADFDHMVKHFYREEHWEQKYIIAENRSGQTRRIPLVSVSIAIVTNQGRPFHSLDDIVLEATAIKKACKQSDLSCYIVSGCLC